MRYTTTMNQEMKRRVTACAAGFSCRATELPSVGLYLDQTVQLVNSRLGASSGWSSPSMVSNYVNKKGVISHPVKKKYSQEQLASLIYIVLSKNVLSLENIDICSRCSGLTAPPPKPTTTSATRWRTACPTIFGASSTICGLDSGCRDDERPGSRRHQCRCREQDVPRLSLSLCGRRGSPLAGILGDLH